ncbi:MAG: hypothetical protein KAX80_15645 [Planctomycetes bacterium]|nr:hypothetical protein [Planctomycetota bacterium]
MAYSFALLQKTATMEVYEVTETLDADIGGDVVHTLGRVPSLVVLTPLLAAARISEYVATAITDALITLSSTNGAGSGDANPQLRVYLRVTVEPVAEGSF